MLHAIILTLEVLALLASSIGLVTLAISMIRETSKTIHQLKEIQPLISIYKEQKLDIAFIKHRLLCIENFMEKDGYKTIPFDEDSFL